MSTVEVVIDIVIVLGIEVRPSDGELASVDAEVSPMPMAMPGSMAMAERRRSMVVPRYIEMRGVMRVRRHASFRRHASLDDA